MAKLQTKTLTATAAKSHHKFTLTVNENTTDIANNQSPMDFTFKLSPVQSGWDWSGWGSSISYSINIGGNIYSGTIPSYDGSSTVTLKTGSLNIKHDEDGKKNIDISFTVTDNTGQSYTPGNASASSTMELTTIPRASSISVSNYDLGQNPNIVIGKKVSSFTSTLNYKIGERTGTLIEKTSDSSYVWEMTEELINQIKTDNPSNKTVSAIIYCDTFDGDIQIGSQTSATFILTITDKPVVVDVVRAELNSNVSALTDKVLRSISQNQFTITANAPTGTTIKSYKVTNDIQGSGDVTSNIVTLNDIQNSYTSDGVLKTKFLITCTDERGNVSEEYPIELDFIDYINVSINKTDIKVTRTNSTTSDAILSLTGNFYNGLIGDTQNEIVLKCKYRIKGEAEYTDLPDLTPTYIENQFKIENIKLEGTYDYQEVHEFLFYAIDSTQVQDDGEFIFASSISIALWHKNGAYIKEIDTDLLAIEGEDIVESGENENGLYIKYYNGTMICMQTIKLENVSASTPWGSLYVYAEEANNWHEFPQIFTEINHFSLDIGNMIAYNGFWLGDYGRKKIELNRWQGLCLIRPTSSTISAEINVLAIGKWK